MELRPYQVDCVNQLRDGYRQGFRRQLLTSPTGSGKTVLFSFITKSSAAKGQRTVIMAHRSEILRQISETLDTVGVPHKVLRAGMATPRLAQTVVASVNTLGRRLDGFPPPDLCIVDECFPAGTMVSTPTGEIPIEQIQPGSEVLSFDPSTERFSVQTVTATMQRKSPRMVDVRIAKKASFTCTANHPVLAISRGWVSAERLTCDDMVLTIMPHEEVRYLWRAVSQQGLRPTGMQIRVQPEDDIEFVQKAWRPNNPIPKDQWNAPSGSQGTGLHEASGHGMEAADSRWQWTGSDVFSKADCLRSRLEYGGSCSDEDAESLWIPNVLQAGRGEHGDACWGGSRWRISPIHGSTDPGPEKRCVSRWARVEGVQVHQPAGGDGSGWVRVYNFEVTGPHTYIANGVVVHNCHHSAAGTWANVFGSWPTTRFLGVTATPERLDGKGLGDYYDRMVRGPEVEWLIANGFLSPPRYFAPARMVDASTIRKVAGEYAKNDAAKLFDKPTITGDAVIQYRKICPGKTAVAFAISIAHAVHVAAQFRGSGIPASVIDGTMTDEQRSQCIADLRARRILVLVSCELISEGFDLPAVETVILLRPTASLALHLQQIGRGLRVSPGKECTFVLDHVGNCLRHGLAEEPRDWSLEGYAARKRKEEDAPLKTRRCEKCFAIFNGPVCPSCGAPYETKGREVENVAGDLKQISPEKLEAIRARKGEERGCKSLEDFQKLGAARGYRPGWAMWRWKNSWRNKPTPA